MSDAEKRDRKIEQLKSQFKTWIGSPISAVALKYGPPQGSFTAGPNRKTFQWVLSGQTLGIAVAVPNTNAVLVNAPQQTTCVVSFTAAARSPHPTLVDWKIDNYAWSGAY